jgi:hypothetical protein
MASRKINWPSPVSESVLGRLFRASPEGLAVLIKTVPPQSRAALAVYCLQSDRLSSLGLAIAASCERRELLCQGGSAVLELIQELRTPKPTAADDREQPAAADPQPPERTIVG